MRSLLSIDWDYFVPTRSAWSGSYVEDKKNLMFIWYKRYFENKRKGVNIEESIKTGKEFKSFFKIIKGRFKFVKNFKMYVSDSHKFSYEIAKVNRCINVINFDAHSDLGYGGLKSLEFEVNCANWFGKLFKDNIIKSGSIVYSPYTKENKNEFYDINDKFNIDYIKSCNIPELEISAVHVCRSGSWTPPWLDGDFKKFIQKFSRPYKIFDCPKRIWCPDKLTLSDKLYMWL